MTSDSENEFTFDDFAFDVLLDDVEASLSEAGFVDYTIPDPHELRSYPSRVLGSKEINQIIDGIDITVNIFSVVRSAYYDGCNFDHFTTIEFCHETYNNISEINDSDIEDVLKENKQKHGKKAISNFKAKITTICHALKTELEAIYKNHTEPLTVTARFSNGETLYSK